ncbi:MAG: TetR/AcrR family transcriptional regulator, partial [Rectinema sp.]|nr:TetR/AcrR family transcriptional regulator [Rectinema sp.]
YTYFDSKQALVETIIEEGWNEYRRWIEEGIHARKVRGSGDTPRETAIDILGFFMDRALPRLFSDVHLIMLLLAEADTSARLKEKLDYLTSLVVSLVSECAGSGSNRTMDDPHLFHTGITVMLLGALETLAIAPKTDIGITQRDVMHFLRHTVENALGFSLPDRG